MAFHPRDDVDRLCVGYVVIETNYQSYNKRIQQRRPDLIIINKKKNFRIVDCAVSPDHRVKFIES